MNRALLLITSMSLTLALGSDLDIQKHSAAAGELKKTLLGELKSKLSEGPASAIEFCSKNALSITDSVAKKHNLNIKRVSEKNRNGNNTPDATDKKALKLFADDMQKNGKPKEFLVVDGRYYEPIVTNGMCIVCHGKEEDIPKPVADKIKQLYPADKATWYGIGELRGAIVVW